MNTDNVSQDGDKTEPASPQPERGETPPESQGTTGVLQGDVGTDAAQVWISAFLIAALGFIVYLYAFSIPLHGEDLTLLGGDSPVTRVVSSLEALPEMPAAPLSILGLSVNARLGGGAVDALHGGSILLHLLCGIFVFLIARRLVPPGTPEAVSMLAGLLFVVHPLASEAVNYLSARHVVQSAFFGLGGVLLLLRGCATLRHSVPCIAASMIAFVLAFGSDAAAIHFPLIGIVLVYFREGKGTGERDFRGVVAVVLLLEFALLWLTGFASGLFETTMMRHGLADSFSLFLARAGHGLHYGLFPMDYALLPVSGNPALGAIALIVLAAALLAGVLWQRLLAILALWVLLALAGPAFFGPADAVGPTRYLYVPWAAVCVLAPWAMQFCVRPNARGVAGGVAAVLILVLGGLTFQRCGLWNRPVDLWTAEQQSNPETLQASRMLGEYLVDQLSRLDASSDDRRAIVPQAIRVWEDVLAARPGDVGARKNLGLLAMQQGEDAVALDHLRYAAARMPATQEVALYRAHVAERRARETGERAYIVEALRALEHAEKLGPLPQPALERYGLLAAQTGDLSTGISILERAADSGGSAELEETLKRYKELAQQLASLASQAETARRESPQSTAPLALQGQRHLLEGRFLDAFYLLRAALEREPGNGSVWTLLGVASARLDGAANFQAEWGDTPAASWDGWKQLALRCGAGNLWSAAEQYVRFGVQKIEEDAPRPEMALAEVALELNQAQRAVTYLEAAQQAYPDDPAPWLRHAEVAIEAGNESQARRFAVEAQARGASPEVIKQLTDRLGGAGPAREGITRTVIQ